VTLSSFFTKYVAQNVDFSSITSTNEKHFLSQ
jgi:hypothetical protein